MDRYRYGYIFGYGYGHRYGYKFGYGYGYKLGYGYGYRFGYRYGYGYRFGYGYRLYKCLFVWYFYSNWLEVKAKRIVDDSSDISKISSASTKSFDSSHFDGTRDNPYLACQ